MQQRLHWMRFHLPLVSVGLVLVLSACDKDTGPLPVEGERFVYMPPDKKPDIPVTTEEPRYVNPYAAIAGEIRFDSAYNGVGDCNAVIALTGTPYAGNCRDCTFAFDVTATLESSGTDCDLIPQWTWLENDVYYDLKLGYGPAYLGLGLEEVLWFGYSIDLTSYGYGTYDGPFWSIVHHDLWDDTFAFDGETLTWGASAFLEYGYGESPYIDYTCNDIRSVPAGPFLEAPPSVDAFPCDDLHMDVYTVDAQAGETLQISVDTMAADTTFQPYLIVNTPDGCLAGTGISSFACTYPPPFGLWCAGLELPVRQTGTYEIVVQAWPGTCATSTADYSLRVDGVSGTPVRLADDPPRFGEIRTLALETQLDATLTWAP